ncbi:hypothetical protein [Pseudomonas guariconensis]|uniref:hypothetical protein n=1 Tax=Pseudomonas guariconensis TaxID=1288410 RepID=UPI00390636A2
MTSKMRTIGKFALAAVASLAWSTSFANIPDDSGRLNIGSKDSSQDAPWNERMKEVTGLFGESVEGRAINDANKGASFSFDTFTPFQDDRTTVVAGYGATEVGVGCNGLNLGTVLDGQIGQYATMVEQFIQNAPTLAIMFLAYSQPTVKSVIDELNSVGQFGLDLSNLTCSGVRNLADKAYEEKKQALAEADCTVDEGFKSSKCMSGEGITGSLVKQMGEFKKKASDRANSMMGKVSQSTGGLVGWNSSTSSGTSASGEGSGPGSSGTGGNKSISGKSCANAAPDGSAGLVFAASELGCEDIKKYAGLIPSYGTRDDAMTVTPRTINLESLSKTMTKEYMELYTSVYKADVDEFDNSKAFKELMSRADIVVSTSEHKYMRTLAKSNPAQFLATERQLATLAMMKELDDVISKIEFGVSSGIANQPDGVLLSADVIERTKVSVLALRQQYQALQSRIRHDQERNKVLSNSAGV